MTYNFPLSLSNLLSMLLYSVIYNGILVIDRFILPDQNLQMVADVFI